MEPAYGERISHSLSMGTPCDLRKVVVLGQARKMEKFCMKIISYPFFTHSNK
jgi:hypothetical protein